MLFAYVDNKGAEQPGYLHSLISAYIVGYLDIMINTSRHLLPDSKPLASFYDI